MKRAFTLVELLAVIFILAILSIVGFKSISTIVQNAKDKSYEVEVTTIKTALKMFASDNMLDMPDEGKTIYLTLYQLKEMGYLKDVVNTKTNKSFSDDTILSITKHNNQLDYNLNEGSQLNDYITSPDLYYEGDILSTFVLGNTYTEDTISARSHDGTNITSKIVKKVYKISSNGTDVEINDLSFKIAGNYKIVYTVTDAGNTVSIIKNVLILGELTLASAIKLDNNVLVPTQDLFASTSEHQEADGLYSYTDDDGTSYFYRGNIINNYVKFGKYPSTGLTQYKYGSDYYVNLEACKLDHNLCDETNKVARFENSDMYWKVVRINGDGTVRMIYAGVSPTSVGQDTGIGKSYYNPNKRDVKNMGYTFDRDTTETNSNVKTYLEQWYNTYMMNYDSDIAITDFVSDSSGFGYNEDYFDNYKRLHEEGTVVPKLDFAGVTFPNYGGIYKLKVGLITIDEAVMAGGKIYISNDEYYLHNGDVDSTNGCKYWTMTPSNYAGDDNHVWWILNDGNIQNTESYSSSGLIRPVINLKTNLKVEGTGTALDPYIIKK